jgi:hypothetical protein
MRAQITLVLAAVTLTAATGRAATVIEKNNFKGKSANVVSNSSSTITCPDGSPGTLQTLIGLSAAETVSKSLQFPNNENNVLFAVVIETSSCDSEVRVRFGSVADGYSPHALQGATLEGEIVLEDGSGTPVGTLVVDVELTASGPIVTDRTHTRQEFETPDGVITLIQRFNGRSRTADATGSLVLDGTLLTGSLVDGFLLDVKAGDLALQR